MSQNKKFNTYLQVYLTVLFFFAAYFFFQKYNNYTEWTISEWLINYQGGFTRRGLIGEIIFQISKFSSFSIREIILISQIFIYFLYFYLVFNFLKNTNKNLLLIFAIFSPLFIIYPISEVEVLGRKEIFTYISFLLVANIFSIKNIKVSHYGYASMIIVISILVWEGIIIYMSFFLFILLIRDNFIVNNYSLVKISFFIVPIIFTIYLVIFKRLDENELLVMCNSVNECYGAMTYLNKNLSSNIGEVTSKFEIIYLIRYLLILIVGFFPLFLLILNSRFSSVFKFKNKNYFPITFALIFLPSFIFYYIAQDWGRWISISYTLSFLTFIYCYKNNFIHISTKKLEFWIFRKKFFTIFIFIIFSFGWSPKTLINEDVSSIPIYRKSMEIIKNFVSGGR